MKKRVRKKKRLGEFKETCFSVGIYFVPECPKETIDTFLDLFIDMIEANRLQCGGGCNPPMKTFGMTICSDVCRPGSKKYYLPVTEEQRAAVIEWCKSRPEIQRLKIGGFRDAWHGWTQKDFDMTFEEEMIGAEALR